MPRRTRSTYVLGAVYGVALLVIGLWPQHVDKNIDVVDLAPVRWLTRVLDLEPRQSYNLIETMANVLLFAPLGLLLMLLWPALRWIHVVLIALLLSSSIELAQALLRPDRTGSMTDVVANTAGAAVAAMLVVVIRGARNS